ncbi:hypothetical protein [Actinocatenispora rupis]|uniref:Uncharacterized protein n=1 Tax=Actinocatenispora rupis TaxID=519421 RepID=A0A8J3J6D5_9ACTN|nr:hypothetical protein [Actinocatenispora rupis]GID11037.1 hypothetical protein Aru02nite_19260 [Actinocatenispora rupis]
MRRTVAVTMTALGVFAGAGCASHNGGARPVPSATRSSSATRSGPSSATASPSPSPTTGPPLTSGPMRARDGRNTAACADGTCEVLVEAGTSFRFADRNGGGTVTVDSVGAAGIDITLAAGVSGAIGSGPRQGRFASLNDVRFEAVAVRGGLGVLRLVRSS